MNSVEQYRTGISPQRPMNAFTGKQPGKALQLHSEETDASICDVANFFFTSKLMSAYNTHESVL